MKKAFTLIELLIVVTIMATLMTIMFRLGAVNSDKSRQLTTVTRMQKLENCLSGYYAAFGSYPPVAIYGSRNIYTEVENGVQTDNQNNGALKWEQIEAACRSQPLEAAFPFSNDSSTREMIEIFSNKCQLYASDWPSSAALCYGSGLTGDFYGLVNQAQYWNASSWKKVQIFRFGLMSYLLPRYLMMMSGRKEFYGAGGVNACVQWSDNNDECISPIDGQPMSWQDVYDDVSRDRDSRDPEGWKNRSNYIKVANMPTQAVCARWINNLRECCVTCNNQKLSTVFGVPIKDTSVNLMSCNRDSPPYQLPVYSPGGRGGNWYLLDTITVLDGWHRQFYYYAPNGAQSYTLWSAGKNGRTFPPWADKTGLLTEKPTTDSGDSSLTIADAIADDIVRLHH